jgi:hypothetical protein
MGSIVSQADEKCYRWDEKRSRGWCVRGILHSPEPSGSPIFWVIQGKTPLRPTSLEAS